MYRRYVRGIVALGLALSVSACNQAGPAAGEGGGGATLAAKEGPEVPYKLGMFEAGKETFVGLVLRDAQVVDLARANAAFENGNSGAAEARGAGRRERAHHHLRHLEAAPRGAGQSGPGRGGASVRLSRWTPCGRCRR